MNNCTWKQQLSLILGLVFCLMSPAIAQVVDKTDSAKAEKPAYTVAVLNFVTDGEQLNNVGQQVSDLVNEDLSKQPGITTVERAQIDKVFGELGIGQSGTVSPGTAARIGHLIGAKIIVTGRVFAAQDELVMTAKVIGTETGKVFAETIRTTLKESHIDASKQLAEKVAALIFKKNSQLLAKTKVDEDPVAKLQAMLKNKKLPTVSVTITERHVGRPALDPAAESEISHVLQSVGFQLVDTATAKQKPDIEITGEAFSEFAMRQGDLVSCKARVDAKAIERSTGKIIAVDRETQTVVDLSEQIAGKTAIQKAARYLASRIGVKLANK